MCATACPVLFVCLMCMFIWARWLILYIHFITITGNVCIYFCWSHDWLIERSFCRIKKLFLFSHSVLVPFILSQQVYTLKVNSVNCTCWIQTVHVVTWASVLWRFLPSYSHVQAGMPTEHEVNSFPKKDFARETSLKNWNNGVCERLPMLAHSMVVCVGAWWCVPWVGWV